MLFSFALMLAVVSTTVEFFTIGQLKFHRQLCAGHKWYNIFYATVISMGLSIEIGRLFGAAGLIAMTGGMISTVLSVFIYELLGEWKTPAMVAKRDRYRKDFESAKQLVRDVGRVIYILLRIITFPIWGYRAVREWFSTQKMRFSR